MFAHREGRDWGAPVQRKVVGGQPLREVSRGVEGSKGGERGERGGEPSSGGVVGRWSARDSEGSQSSPVAAVDVNKWEAGFACEDGGGGRVEVVGDPSADPMPEGVHRLGGAMVGDQEVGPVREDGEEKAHGDLVG